MDSSGESDYGFYCHLFHYNTAVFSNTATPSASLGVLSEESSRRRDSRGIPRRTTEERNH